MERNYGDMIKRLWAIFSNYEKEYLMHAAKQFGDHIKNGGLPTDDTSERNFNVFMIMYRHSQMHKGGYKPNLYGVDNKEFMQGTTDDYWNEALEVLASEENSELSRK